MDVLRSVALNYEFGCQLPGKWNAKWILVCLEMIVTELNWKKADVNGMDPSLGCNLLVSAFLFCDNTVWHFQYGCCIGEMHQKNSDRSVILSLRIEGVKANEMYVSVQWWRYETQETLRIMKDTPSGVKVKNLFICL
jgi:hypothetical protein